MQVLIDSKPLAGDGDALRARIRADGYVFLRGLLDAAVVDAARRAVVDGLRAGGWFRDGSHDGGEAIALPVHATDQAHAWKDPGYRAAGMTPAFNALPYAPALRQLMRRIMGPRAFSYPVKVLRVVYPAELVPAHGGMHVHTDYAVIGVQDLFTTWVPLMPISSALGGLAVLPGSQRTGPRPPRLLSADTMSDNTVSDDAGTANWATADYLPGDVLVFHCLTSHAALPNQTSGFRLSGDFRWQLADDPVPRPVVFGPNRDGVELWSRLFRRARWWEPVPDGLRFVDDRVRPVPGSAVPPSRFVDVPPGPWRGGQFVRPPH